MDDVMEMQRLVVPAPAVWLAVLALVGTLTYATIWAVKDAARWIGRRWLGWTADPKWNGALRVLSLAVGAALGFGLYHYMAPDRWPWGLSIGALAGSMNVVIFRVVKTNGKKRLAQAIIGMEARRAEDTLDEREGEP